MTESTDFDVMVFDTYAPRADADARGYDEWLAKVDAPLFNSLSSVAGYYCWRVDSAIGNRVPYGVGAQEPYTYFGFFGLRSEGDFAAMMADPKAEAHVPIWVRDWSRHPEAKDLAENFFFSMAKRTYVWPGERTPWVVLIPHSGRLGVQPGFRNWAEEQSYADVEALVRKGRYETWVVTATLQGAYDPPGVDLVYLSDPDGFDDLLPFVENAVLGRLVAEP